MKHIIAITSTLLLSFILMACSNTSNDIIADTTSDNVTLTVTSPESEISTVSETDNNIPTHINHDEFQVTLSGFGDYITMSAKSNINDAIIIGRQDTSDICIPGNEYISRTHCQLSYSDGLIYLTDLESTNGTYIKKNNQWVQITEPVEIIIGQEFMIADMSLTLIDVQVPKE